MEIPTLDSTNRLVPVDERGHLMAYSNGDLGGGGWEADLSEGGMANVSDQPYYSADLSQATGEGPPFAMHHPQSGDHIHPHHQSLGYDQLQQQQQQHHYMASEPLGHQDMPGGVEGGYDGVAMTMPLHEDAAAAAQPPLSEAQVGRFSFPC